VGWIQRPRHAGSEAGVAAAEDAAEDELQLLGSAEIELVRYDRLEERRSMEWAVEDLGAVDLCLEGPPIVTPAKIAHIGTGAPSLPSGPRV